MIFHKPIGVATFGDYTDEFLSHAFKDKLVNWN